MKVAMAHEPLNDGRLFLMILGQWYLKTRTTIRQVRCVETILALNERLTKDGIDL